jgi:molybdopterin molybdotransferase
VETVRLEAACGRILAEPLTADRDHPAMARSVRDGFALRAADTPGELRLIGEVRAGEVFGGGVGPGECVEIMTGAPVPDGADAVVMVEHVESHDGMVECPQRLEPGIHINPVASECRVGDVVLPAGRMVGYPEVAFLASIGAMQVPVFRRPRVAVLATGDELVSAELTPAPHQIRNSNSWSLAAQVRRAGGEPEILPVAPDTLEGTIELVSRGLSSDLLLLSGGVSAGKYDVVEQALRALGAEFFFDRVLIQPGQPLVFGRASGTFFFGLPGNPASTMVCFEVFARAAMELIAGRIAAPLPLLEATLAETFRHKPGLTRFLPAVLHGDGQTLSPVKWTGSSDISAVARANCFLVAEPDKPVYAAGERIRVLLR